MFTVLEIIKKTTDFLAAKGVESPRLNAELLIGHALGRKRMQLYMEFERPLTEAELEKIRPLVRRRALREPLQYIVGETEFCGLRLAVDRRALIPRPETELLVEHVQRMRAATPPGRILDLGTGSGAIALALATAFPAAAVLAVDRSAAALELARSNAALTGLEARVTLVESDWFGAVPAETFDVVVSNPPYLSEEETTQTAPEVREFEPRSALASADDGAADLARIIAQAPRFLVPGGLLALETGISQHARLLPLVRSAGYASVESHLDLRGRERFILAVK
ncbi:MAG: peptide chain release factor N(5)-glutamine methyltransferase [Opitutaceae bacterium]|nr:peptide chain release factor N(5)-glutamine methyltransferase [Opitutaceae bacterium]